MDKTQKQIAQLLGTSLKAIHSYEQGWRTIPAHAERQILFLTAVKNKSKNGKKACWTLKKCPPGQKENCPAWEFRTGDLCWFINGTICNGGPHKDWKTKMTMCRECTVYQRQFDNPAS
jgi:hypothetical protein